MCGAGLSSWPRSGTASPAFWAPGHNIVHLALCSAFNTHKHHPSHEYVSSAWLHRLDKVLCAVCCAAVLQLRNMMLMGVLAFTSIFVGAGITLSFTHIDQPTQVSVW
jgi:hypothetical protein